MADHEADDHPAPFPALAPAAYAPSAVVPVLAPGPYAMQQPIASAPAPNQNGLPAVLRELFRFCVYFAVIHLIVSISL